MKMSSMYMPTLREIPAEAVVQSHQLLLRAAMIRKLGNGLYTYLPLGFRVFQKIAQIIRFELDACGFFECKPPIIVPGELWQESGRWDSMGEELLRLKNRLNQDLVVSPTAEEPFTALVRHELTSYKDYPLSLYQINTKYRDEIRPRYGLMRTREFTMKDGYSFHTSEECLDTVYHQFGAAYRKIFKRCGLSVIAVGADTGAMGGSGSEEFMVESEIGDNTLILCSSCDYAMNVEKASCVLEPPTRKPATAALEAIHTPNVKTIAELTDFLKTSPDAFIKTLVYTCSPSPLFEGRFVAVCIRGDLDINETKLKARLAVSELELASNVDIEKHANAPVGFVGPVGLTGMPLVVDHSVMQMHDAVAGALRVDTHFIHVEPGRDFSPDFEFDLREVKAGDICPECHKPLYEKKGNELGHIFKLGDKYTRSMNMTYLDEQGKTHYPLMGCYGIGLDRLLASIVEEHHDEHGICWPISVAPYQVAIIPIKYEGGLKTVADTLYERLLENGVEVLLDNRDVRTGVKFKDIDLIGIPIQLIVGEKNLPKIELKMRHNPDAPELVSQEAVCDAVLAKIKETARALNA